MTTEVEPVVYRDVEHAITERHPNLLTPTEAYGLMGFSKSAGIRNARRDGWPRIKVGGKVYFKRRELLALYDLGDVA